MNNIQSSKEWKLWPLYLFVLILPFTASFYKYYLTKNYYYLIEAKCDPSIETCFSRDCSTLDDCPPNELSNYKEFYIKAYDFFKCSDNSCIEECSKNVINCIPIVCGKSADDICTNPLT